MKGVSQMQDLCTININTGTNFACFFHMLKITNMVMVGNSEVISGNFQYFVLVKIMDRNKSLLYIVAQK
jgi:hypothetical protein